MIGVKEKLHNQKGFSLGEILVAVLILLMVSSVVAGGIPVARNAYNKVVVAANAEVLLSTAISALEGELGTATRVENDTDDENTNTGISYYKNSTGSISRISYDKTSDSASKNSLKGILIENFDRYIDETKTENNESPRQLISRIAGTSDLIITFDSIFYYEESGLVKIKNLDVKKDQGNKLEDVSRAHLDNLTIRIIAG